jgi:hypothetical protein
LHDRRGCGHHLGQRCDIKNGIHRHQFAAGFQRAVTECLAVDHFVVVANQNHRTGSLAIVNGLFDDWSNDGKAVWRRATLLSRGTGYRDANQAKNSDPAKPTGVGTQIQVPLGCANTLTLHGVSGVAQGGHSRGGTVLCHRMKAEAEIWTLSVLGLNPFLGRFLPRY